MRELFIYYRIHAAQAERARAAVLDFQARLRARHPALSTQLYQRTDQSTDLPTWMETYALRDLQGRGVDDALQAEIEAEAACLAGAIAGTRHTESFRPCVS